jgi:hypothetical protein
MEKQTEADLTAYKTPEVVTYTKEELLRLVGPVVGAFCCSSIHVEDDDDDNNDEDNDDDNDDQ